jgi:hydrogenase maturation protease
VNQPEQEILVIGIGSDILGDDAVGLIAARELKKEFSECADIIETSTSSLDLLELVKGYDSVLILDAMRSTLYPIGTIIELSRQDFRPDVFGFGHHIGVPEVFMMADLLGISLPKDIRILAMEVDNPYVVQEFLSDYAANALPSFLEKARNLLEGWKS